MTRYEEADTLSKMGKYCKVYPITRFREYPGWTEKSENIRREKQIANGEEVEMERQLTDDDYLYLQENYTVTDGIFLDENIIFDNVDPEWVDFCKNTLQFEVLDYEPIKTQQQGG